MKAIYDWKEMLKTVCKEQGWEENKNCKIKYEAQANVVLLGVWRVTLKNGVTRLNVS